MAAIYSAPATFKTLFHWFREPKGCKWTWGHQVIPYSRARHPSAGWERTLWKPASAAGGDLPAASAEVVTRGSDLCCSMRCTPLSGTRSGLPPRGDCCTTCEWGLWTPTLTALDLSWGFVSVCEVGIRGRASSSSTSLGPKAYLDLSLVLLSIADKPSAEVFLR